MQQGRISEYIEKEGIWVEGGSVVIFPFHMFYFTVHVIIEVKQFTGPPSVVSSVRSVSRRAARQQQQAVPIATQG